MKIALPATLAIGGLSLLFALLAAFMFYVEWLGQSPLQATAPSSHFAESVASAQDFATLKLGCHSLAQSLDNSFALAHTQFAMFKRFAGGIALFTLVWGLVCGTVLLYVHLLLRRVVKARGL